MAACAVLPPLVALVPLGPLARVAGRLPHRAGWAPADADAARYVASVLTSLPRPWRYTCLKRGLVLYHLLRRAGRPVGLHIGVRKDELGALQAHAWLVKDGAGYLEPDAAEHRAYRVIASFPEPTAA